MLIFIAMTLEEKFENAADRSLQLAKKPSPTDMQLLYGLYKQATVGDNPNTKPKGFDMIAMGKHQGWLAQKGTSRAQAMEAYVAKVEALEAAQNT